MFGDNTRGDIMVKPKRVLICGLTDNKGGLETYIMNIYRNIDRRKLQFDFLYGENGTVAFSDEIKKLGGHIYHIPRKYKHPIRHFLLVRKLFKENNYEGLYFQCNVKLRTIELFKLAKKYGVKKRVIHSHNTKKEKRNKIILFREWYTSKLYDKYCTDFFACSKAAGKWMFNNRKFSVVNNCIDTDVFKYDEICRDALRNSLKIKKNTVVLGTVGKLDYQKNPEFMVEVFNFYHKMNPDSIFIHIGDGIQHEKIQRMVESYGLSDSYYLKGLLSDVSNYLNAMDIFLLPSRFEGFPIVLVEAQSVGLPCVVSSNVTKESKITDLVNYKEINSPKSWAYEIEKIQKKYSSRTDKSEIICEQGYGIKKLADMIQGYFC